MMTEQPEPVLKLEDSEPIPAVANPAAMALAAEDAAPNVDSPLAVAAASSVAAAAVASSATAATTTTTTTTTTATATAPAVPASLDSVRRRYVTSMLAQQPQKKPPQSAAATTTTTTAAAAADDEDEMFRMDEAEGGDADARRRPSEDSTSGRKEGSTVGFVPPHLLQTKTDYSLPEWHRGPGINI